MKYAVGGIVLAALVIVVIVWLRGAPERMVAQPTTPPQLSVTEKPPAPTGGLINKTKDNMTIETTHEGTGPGIVNGQTAVVEYTGKLADGSVFDASSKHGQPFSFPLGAGMVIKGWDQGVLGMKVGETRVLTIPPELGYGAAGYPPIIPQNATLTFEVTLVAIK
jgi:FKBP-type peptidyl-prolyl cis-trans isomerase